MSKDQNWENGSFEEFIRRSVEDPQLEFDPGAWNAMEEKLDAQAGGTRSGETRSGGTGHAGNAGKIWAGVAVLLLMSLLGWFLLSGTEENTLAVDNQERPQLSAPVATNSDPSVWLPQQEFASAAGERGEQLWIPANPREDAGSPIKGSAAEKVPGSSAAAELNGREGAAASAFNTAPTEAGPASSRGKGSGRLVNDQALHTDMANAGGGGAKETLAEDNAAEQRLQSMAWQDFIFNTKEISPVLPAVQGVQLVREEEVVPAGSQGSLLSLSLSLAPDFSGMSKHVSARLGAGAGFHLEYRLLPRLGFVTGLVYSQKNYLTSSSYFPYDFGYTRPKADYIDASCGVLDIPLNLRYYLFQGQRHGFFLSTGLSSYLMKREDYTLVYENAYYEDYTYALRNENRHYFAVYNFSAGYEARMSSRWALQAEPFLKIPARGLGAGSIRLNSIGAFLHLKYNIGRLGK